MDVSWPRDIIPSKIKSNLNCRCQLTCDDRETQNTKAKVLPVYIRCTTLLQKHNYLTENNI